MPIEIVRIGADKRQSGRADRRRNDRVGNHRLASAMLVGRSVELVFGFSAQRFMRGFEGIGYQLFCRAFPILGEAE